MKPTKILFQPIESKTIAWFQSINEYVIFEKETAAIIKLLQEGIPAKEIAVSLASTMEAPLEDIQNLIKKLSDEFLNPQEKDSIPKENLLITPNKPAQFEISETYVINDVVCKVSFLSKKERELVHPKFEHLSVSDSINYHHLFEVFIKKNKVILFVDDTFIGAWFPKDVHYFQGKFSMELIQKIHQKEEAKWLGVFHASAVSDGKTSILFLGDSGNGKSTSLALLQANGFNCLADDFVPIAAENSEVYSFPAAISVKKNSIPILLPLYPKLAETTEYHLTRLNKIVRYLPPNNSDYKAHLPCKKLVFIKYNPTSDLQVNPISKLDAFEQLIPDSWLSPLPKNAAIFLDWFAKMDCYQIIYSDNDRMIATVRELFG